MFLADEKIKEKGSSVALGYFDGIHTGHTAVLNKALERARLRGLVPVVMLFDIHPRKLISGKIPPMLTSEERKREILTDMGFTVVDFNFRQAIDFSPEEFIEKILVDSLNARAVCCGFDYHYGKGGKGDAVSMKKQLAERDIEFFSIEPVILGKEIVSSTFIRQLIAEGEIEKANTMLGHPFSYDFVVRKGDGRGRTIGFPTINQFFPQDFIVPKYGVYASVTRVGTKKYPSVTNVGIRPTVSMDSMRSETCILDFSGDLYGKRVEVSLIKYLRGEIKFPNVQALRQAIAKDIENARKVLKENG